MPQHDVGRHGTFIMQTDPSAPEVENVNVPGMELFAHQRDLVNYKSADCFDPRDLANLSHIKTAMGSLTEAELQQMVKDGVMAEIALKVRRGQRITTDEVNRACLSTINF